MRYTVIANCESNTFKIKITTMYFSYKNLKYFTASKNNTQ